MATDVEIQKARTFRFSTAGLAKEAEKKQVLQLEAGRGVSKMAKRELSQEEQDLTSVLTDAVLAQKQRDGVEIAGELAAHIHRRRTLTPDVTQAELALGEAKKILRRGLPNDPAKRKRMSDLVDRLRTELHGL